LHVARGALLDETFVGDAVGYDAIVGRELFSLIVPGYLLVPFLLQPLAEYVLPYFLYKWLIRADIRMHLRAAEKAMEPPEFDIVWRYSDTLNNFVVCMVLLMFLTPASGNIMLWLFVFILYIYGLDRLRLIKHSITYYTTERLTVAFAIWWTIPSGMLAGIVAWWGVKAGSLTHFPPFTMVSIAVVAHVLVYLSVVLVQYVIMKPIRKCAQGEYADALRTRRKAGKGFDYFTANPGHCLKTWGSKEELFTCTTGKMHLLPWEEWDCGDVSHNFSMEVDVAGVMSGRFY